LATYSTHAENLQHAVAATAGEELITEMPNSKDPATATAVLATTTAIEEEEEEADAAPRRPSPLLPAAVARRGFCAS